jgi:hypothetical protein
MPLFPEQTSYSGRVWRKLKGIFVKSNDAEATLRKGNMPKESAVTTVSPDVSKGVAKELAELYGDERGQLRFSKGALKVCVCIYEYNYVFVLPV